MSTTTNNHTDTPATLKIGWIGLGDQGAPMARAIAEAGFDLHVWARREASLTALDGLPYTREADLAALGEASDVVGLCLREDSDIEDTLTRGGLMASLHPGAILINHGTGLPGYATAMAEQGAETGVIVLDAPVSGGRAGAQSKTLTTIVGGPEQALEKVRPVLESFSAKIAHMGPIRSGQMGKLINNALLMMNQRNVQEILVLGQDLEIKIPVLIDLLLSSTGRSFAMEALTGAVTVANAEHLKVLQMIDMDIFTAAMNETGHDVTAIDEYARSGVKGLPGVADLVASNS